jgi:hypothetical protein
MGEGKTIGKPPDAPPSEERFQISPFAGLRFGGGFEGANGQSYSLESGLSYGVTLDLDVLGTEEQIEVLYSRQETTMSPNPPGIYQPIDVDVQMIQIGLTQEIGTSEKFKPFLSGLVGATLLSSEGASDVYFSFGLAGGIKYFPIKNVGLRLDLRGYGTVVENNSSAVCVDGRCVVSFSGDLFWQGEVTASLVIRF